MGEHPRAAVLQASTGCSAPRGVDCAADRQMPRREQIHSVYADISGHEFVITSLRRRSNGAIDKQFLHRSTQQTFRSLRAVKRAVEDNALARNSSQQQSTCVCKDEAQIEVDPDDDNPPAPGHVWKLLKSKRREFCTRPLCTGAECYEWKQCVAKSANTESSTIVIPTCTAHWNVRAAAAATNTTTAATSTDTATSVTASSYTTATSTTTAGVDWTNEGTGGRAAARVPLQAWNAGRDRAIGRG